MKKRFLALLLAVCALCSMLAAPASASAPTAVTVAGTEYTIGTASAAAQISSLNGGGVGQVVTLLLGMDDQVVRVLTGDQADAVFYGVVQSASRSLTEDNGADVQQSVAVACTDGVTRTVHVDKSLNFPAGWQAASPWAPMPRAM